MEPESMDMKFDRQAKLALLEKTLLLFGIRGGTVEEQLHALDQVGMELAMTSIYLRRHLGPPAFVPDEEEKVAEPVQVEVE